MNFPSTLCLDSCKYGFKCYNCLGVHFGSATFGPSSPLRSGILNDRLYFPASISGTTSPVQPSVNQPVSVCS